jgi:ketosteroid isomerase-like protein
VEFAAILPPVDAARLQLLRQGYAAINAGDVEGALRHLHPDVVIASSGAFLDEGAVYRGHEGVREFLRMLGDAFEEYCYEVLELTGVEDDSALALFRVSARGKGSGVDVTMEGGHLWTLRGEKAIRLEAFADHESARAASEQR